MAAWQSIKVIPLWTKAAHHHKASLSPVTECASLCSQPMANVWHPFSPPPPHTNTHTHPRLQEGSIVVIETLSLDKWLLPRAVRLTLTEQSTLCYLCPADKESFWLGENRTIPLCPRLSYSVKYAVTRAELWNIGLPFLSVYGPSFESLSYVVEIRPGLFIGDLSKWTSCQAVSSKHTVLN